MEDRKKCFDDKRRGSIEIENKECIDRRQKLNAKVAELKALDKSPSLPALSGTSKSHVADFTKKLDDALIEFDGLTRER